MLFSYSGKRVRRRGNTSFLRKFRVYSDEAFVSSSQKESSLVRNERISIFQKGGEEDGKVLFFFHQTLKFQKVLLLLFHGENDGKWFPTLSLACVPRAMDETFSCFAMENKISACVSCGFLQVFFMCSIVPKKKRIFFFCPCLAEEFIFLSCFCN